MAGCRGWIDVHVAVLSLESVVAGSLCVSVRGVCSSQNVLSAGPIASLLSCPFRRLGQWALRFGAAQVHRDVTGFLLLFAFVDV